MSKIRGVTAIIATLITMAYDPADAHADMNGYDLDGANIAEHAPPDRTAYNWGNPIICPIGHQQCGQKCYDPFSSQCFPGGIICAHGHQVCGTKCYDPFSSRCFVGGIVCPHGHQLCGTKCYDPFTSTCH